MTRNTRRFHDTMKRAFAPVRHLPDERVDMACRRVLSGVRDDADRLAVREGTTSVPTSAPVRRWVRPIVGLATAAVIITILQLPVVRELAGPAAIARVETSEGGLYLASGKPMRSGDSIAAQSPIRTNGGTGAVLSLTDGSRVEMRSQSELALERADDGLRIRLSRGGIIVNAAKQRDGHLYVQTKDVIVSVVGTVFLVNAEEHGSRVAVIEGEVRVTHGAAGKNLLPGEQVATSLAMPPTRINEEISWSRNAGMLDRLLQQAAPGEPVVVSPSPAGKRETFEVASIRLGTPVPSGGGRGRPADGACDGRMQLDPARVAITGATLNYLVSTAYGLSSPSGGVVAGCADALQKKRLSGGPDWAGADRFDIEGKIPAGPRPYEERVVDSRGGVDRSPNPRLLEMLRTLLESRFNLVVRREQRSFPAYLLVTAPGGPKLAASKEGEPSGSSVTRNGSYQEYKNGIAAPKPYGDLHVGHISARRGSMGILARQIGRFTPDRVVIDRTGITGEFTYEIFFEPYGPVPDGKFPLIGPTLEGVLREELGLELKPSLEPVEFLIIERVERPTPN
jgi:uncharacterized protein (TIGR03435 family)